jgi:hypothetical protein
MNENERAKTIKLIGSIQSGEAGGEELNELERITGNPNASVIFHLYELEGMLPGKIFDLFFGRNETVGCHRQ